MRFGLKSSLLALVTAITCVGSANRAEAAECQTIVQIAQSVGAVSTLVTALGAADLVQLVNGPGPITVFAPVNGAFDKIPRTDLDALLGNKPALRSTVLAHLVVGREFTAAALSRYSTPNYSVGGTLPMANGGGQYVRQGQTNLQIGSTGANVIRGDITACNGVIHLIDTVLSTGL